MARNQWQDWILSPFYLRFISAQPVYPSGHLYESIITRLSLPAEQRILLAGCGNGQKAAELAADGREVTGTDYSASLIDIALASASDNLHFFQHDLRLPFWSNYFGLAFITSRSFGTYDTKREHDNLIRTIAGSLVPGGYTVLEYINTGYLEQNPFNNEERDIEGTHYRIVHHQDATHFYSTITVTDPTITEPAVYVHKKQKFSTDDFTAMLTAQGLEVLELFGDDRLGRYDLLDAPKLIMIARKTKAEEADADKRLYSDGRTTDALT